MEWSLLSGIVNRSESRQVFSTLHLTPDMLPAMLGVFIIVHKTADIVISVITEVKHPNFGQLWKVVLCCIFKKLPAYIPNLKQTFEWSPTKRADCWTPLKSSICFLNVYSLSKILLEVANYGFDWCVVQSVGISLGLRKGDAWRGILIVSFI